MSDTGERDLVGKPVSTFPDHALSAAPWPQLVTASIGETALEITPDL
jgi:hypothetical protein